MAMAKVISMIEHVRRSLEDDARARTLDLHARIDRLEAMLNERWPSQPQFSSGATPRPSPIGPETGGPDGQLPP